ncbi:SDR family oxidoreductase [Psychromarinibacter sp. S121]|uniref:SDR family oxidoreductase n=1 Tax=Psychromarinibacter sp. S121 TaxID=3415127 RepID=UPI003C7DAC80
MDLGIAGRRALVCGASAGIGFACAKVLAEEGCKVVMVARDAARLDAAVAQIPGARGVAADLGAEGVEARLLAEVGPVDILVTNPGVSPAGSLTDAATVMAATEAVPARTMALIGAFLPGMREGGWGRVVNITSSGVFASGPALGLSGAVRAALTHMAASLAQEVAPDGVTVNCIAPGPVDTAGLQHFVERRARETGQTIEEVRAARLASLPTGRFSEPDEVGALCAFLASGRAANITGRTVLADGGANAFPFL